MARADVNGARDGLRLIAATALFVVWFALLLFGHPLGIAVHLLLAGALVVLPWRLVRP